HSSAMMSLQSSMHSSQMYTVGPAMSLRTSFWLLPQNEHFRVPLPSRVRPAILLDSLLLGLRRHCGRFADRARRGLAGDDLVYDSIVLRLLGGHEKVPVGILLDLLHSLAGVVDEDAVELLAHPQYFLGLDVDVRRLALHAAKGLVDHDPRVRQREPLAPGAGAQQQRAPRRGLAHADRRDGRIYVLSR